jgi:hypothetical protein
MAAQEQAEQQQAMWISVRRPNLHDLSQTCSKHITQRSLLCFVGSWGKL